MNAGFSLKFYMMKILVKLHIRKVFLKNLLV
uniref:Uncharacterized protein n=1 Tax=Siphoviridae sp. ct2vX3 TaxID=2825318 RepID=A0A8S5PZ40_9CAUD|nr:MAG TPA: hypothetical protein [Siphoviridae sp. ct2vX3]